MRELLKVFGLGAAAVLFWLLIYTLVQAEISEMRLQTRYGNFISAENLRDNAGRNVTGFLIWS